MSEIIKLINESLNADNFWKKKNIPIFTEWLPVMDKVLWAYKNAGWSVFHIRCGKEHYLEFER